MEISALVKEITEAELRLETEEKETVRLPKRLFPGVVVGQTVYLTIAKEPGRSAREIVNELLTTDDTD